MLRAMLFEPDPMCQEKLAAALTSRGLLVTPQSNLADASKLVARQSFHVIMWSVRDSESVDGLAEIREHRPSSAIITTSYEPTPGLIVGCMRLGANHFYDLSSGQDGLSKVLDETLTRSDLSDLSDEPTHFPIPEFIGRHPKIVEIFKIIMNVRNSDANVLITGESGTGKEVVARAIHQLSPRRTAPWVAINCSAIPTTLLESELFGHMKGAFTGATQNRPGRFQMAGNGTLFLDEIADLSFDVQAKLLRAIQSRIYEPVGSPHSLKLEARVIAATNQDLEKMVGEKRFREDLFYRLNVIPITLPPLRHRKTDIPLLVRAFMKKFSDLGEKGITGISEQAMRCLMEYHWPGNIRELENLMERVIVLKQSGTIIELGDLPVQHFRRVRLDRYVSTLHLPEDGLDLNQAVSEFENELILQALQRTSGNKNQAASLLKLNRTTLVEKLKRKNLQVAS